jgi:hypothetical protein
MRMCCSSSVVPDTQFEVLDPVVVTLAVPVMDGLVTFERPPHVVRHNGPVLKNRGASAAHGSCEVINGHANVALGEAVSPTLPIRSALALPTFLRIAASLEQHAPERDRSDTRLLRCADVTHPRIPQFESFDNARVINRNFLRAWPTAAPELHALPLQSRVEACVGIARGLLQQSRYGLSRGIASRKGLELLIRKAIFGPSIHTLHTSASVKF